MTFAAIIEYAPEPAKIAELRPVHRAYLKELLDKGNLAISGPFTDDTGGLIVYEAASAEEAESLMRNDPFFKSGFFVSWKIRPWLRRLVTRLIAIVPAVIVIGVYGEDKVTDLLNVSQIILGVQLPLAMESGRRHGMIPLNDALAALVREGTVHVTEAYLKAFDKEGLLAALKRDGVDTSFAERLA